MRRHSTENPCPTKEQILDAWERAKDTNEDLIRFGSLIEALACYVDSSLIRTEDGEIVGRRGGVKAWLQENIPALYLKYKTVMAYKAAAKKLRQVTELPEPLPVARIVEEIPVEAQGNDVSGKFEVEARQQGERPGVQGRMDVELIEMPVEVVRARAVYLEVMRDPPRNRSALLDRIDAYVDPGRVEEATMLAAWKEKWKGKITVRTKSRWMKGLWKKAG